MPSILDPHLTIILNPDVIQIHDTARIDGLVKIEGGLGVTIGANVHIASFSHINKGGGRLTLEDNATISGATIITGTNDLADWQTVHKKELVVGAGAAIFSRAVVMANVGENAVVGAGAVVTKDVPAGEVWVGNPATFLKMRLAPRLVKFNWNSFFDWYVRQHKHAPPYKPCEWVKLHRTTETTPDYGLVGLESKEAGFKIISVPIEFLEVANG